MFVNRKIIVAGALAILPASLAGADTLTAHFNYDLLQNVNITSPVVTAVEPAVVFHWTRADSPGAGIDSTVPVAFTSFCIDLAQNVSPGVNNTYNVLLPGAYGFTGTQTTLLTELWGTYLDSVNTPTASGAFQTAVWELVYDTDHNLSTGAFHVNSGGAVTTLAQSWLDRITSPDFVYAGPAIEARVLQSNSLQDQVTFVPVVSVPAPATAVLGMSAAAFAFGRRKR